MSKTEQQDVLAAIKRANEVVSALCDGRARWTMSVPAEPDSDPDLVISRALHLAEKRISELERIADQAWMCAELDKHNDTPWGEAFDELARLCADYRPRSANPFLVALCDVAAARAEGEG